MVPLELSSLEKLHLSWTPPNLSLIPLLDINLAFFFILAGALKHTLLFICPGMKYLDQMRLLPALSQTLTLPGRDGDATFFQQRNAGRYFPSLQAGQRYWPPSMIRCDGTNFRALSKYLYFSYYFLRSLVSQTFSDNNEIFFSNCIIFLKLYVFISIQRFD